jgi:hypothetical protein
MAVHLAYVETLANMNDSTAIRTLDVPSTFSHYARPANQDGHGISKRTEGDEKV